MSRPSASDSPWRICQSGRDSRTGRPDRVRAAATGPPSWYVLAVAFDPGRGRQHDVRVGAIGPATTSCTTFSRTFSSARTASAASGKSRSGSTPIRNSTSISRSAAAWRIAARPAPASAGRLPHATSTSPLVDSTRRAARREQRRVHAGPSAPRSPARRGTRPNRADRAASRGRRDRPGRSRRPAGRRAPRAPPAAASASRTGRLPRPRLTVGGDRCQEGGLPAGGHQQVLGHVVQPGPAGVDDEIFAPRPRPCGSEGAGSGPPARRPVPPPG